MKLAFWRELHKDALAIRVTAFREEKFRAWKEKKENSTKKQKNNYSITI